MTQNLSPDPELDALVRKLNETAHSMEEAREAPESSASPAALASAPARGEWVPPRGSPDGHERITHWLSQARSAGASDLLLVSGCPATVRVHGRIEPLSGEALSPSDCAVLAAALVPRERRATLAASGSVDFAFQLPGSGSFRCNVHRERGRWSTAIRLFPTAPPELDSLNLPPTLARFAELDHGLVLVTGPTGSGKSTTLAALLRAILARRRAHVITIEDPVEYEHAHSGSVVEHVEIGRDAASFASALRSALRQNPDVLLVGEMRDRDSISITITAAETGHLVLSTLHTGDAPQTVSRILDSYPSGQMEAVRAQLAASLAGIVSQQLLPRADGSGRVPAVEILFATHGCAT